MFCPQSTRDVREIGLSEGEDAKATKRKRPDREEQPPQNYLRSFLRPSLPLGSRPLIEPTQSTRHRPFVHMSFDAYRPKACTPNPPSLSNPQPNLMQPVLGNGLGIGCGKLVHFLLARHDVDLADLDSKWRAPQSFVPNIQRKEDGQRNVSCEEIGG